MSSEGSEFSKAVDLVSKKPLLKAISCQLRIDTLDEDMVKIITLISFLMLLFGCAQKVPFLKSSIVPGAVGYVKVSKDRNDNTKVELTLEHLAFPERLSPSQKTYMLWAETAGGYKNLGQILVAKDSSAALSSLLYGEEFKLIITAEMHPDANVPSSLVLLSTETIKTK